MQGPTWRVDLFRGALFNALLAAVLLGVTTPALSAADDAGASEVGDVPGVPESVADLSEIERRVAAVVQQTAPATVCVRAGGGSGSGVIISEDGYVLTAGHVSVEPGRNVTFIFPDGSTARGQSLGLNVGIDAGLMKITDEGPWPFVEMGEMGSVASGDWVVAMGHPGGFDPERPIVARLGRVYRVRSTVIQTDCTIIGGDSGGPLFDLDGKVIGIHSRISNSLRQNFHVPISAYTGDWDKLAAGEVWNRPVARGGVRPGGPFIGVRGATDRALGEGARLADVTPGSPAARAGLQPGDVVVEFDRSPIGSFGDLAEVVGNLEPGDRVGLIVQRGDQPIELEIEIGRAGGR